MNNNFKMPVILIGNSFKYEIEATLKLFFHENRFAFSDDINEAAGDNYVIASVKNDSVISAQIMLNGELSSLEATLDIPVSDDKDTAEHELCRLIYRILSERTGIRPPWGLMTGIRPVKKFVELIRQDMSREQIYDKLSQKYEISPEKLDIGYITAENQLPILDRINSRAVSLYVSIPFCPTRCSYCSFVSHSMDSAVKLMPDYVRMLCRELEITAQIVKETNTEIDTVYFGGGTPTSISAEDLRTIMECVAKNFDLAKIREYSVEAGRPDTITEEKLRVIKELGAQRISVNPQTLNDDVLRVIGRKHTGEDAVRAFELARKIGFTNINTDLIAGLPTETPESFRNTLDRITELDPESITVHTLTIKRAANLFEKAGENNNNPAAEMVSYSIDKLLANGYLPY